MLTVNVKGWGSERILEASEVKFFNLPQVTNDSPLGEIHLKTPNGDEIIDKGVVYVMNFHGATVAKYELSDIHNINGDSK